MKKQVKALQLEGIRLTSVVWNLGLVVLIAAYTGILFSDKVAPENNLLFKDFETFVTCLEENRWRMIQSTLSVSNVQFLTGIETKLGRRIQATYVKRPVIVKPIPDTLPTILAEQDTSLVWIASKVSFERFSTYYIIQTASFTPWKKHGRRSRYKEAMTFPARKILRCWQNSIEWLWCFAKMDYTNR